MKHICKKCGKEVDVTKFGKVAPHNNGTVRCSGSGKRVEKEKTK